MMCQVLEWRCQHQPNAESVKKQIMFLSASKRICLREQDSAAKIERNVCELDKDINEKVPELAEKLTLITAINFLIKAWNGVTDCNLINCWRKSGLVSGPERNKIFVTCNTLALTAGLRLAPYMRNIHRDREWEAKLA